MPSPPDERELVARLAPESPIMFERARRLLRDMTRDGAARFRAGVVEDGCRSVLHGENGWQAAHRDDSAGALLRAGTSDHPTARAATAHAVSGILSEEGVSLNSTILEIAGLIRQERHTYTWTWTLTETAQRISAESRNAAPPSGTPCIALEGVVGRAGYIVLRPVLTPPEGPFMDIHTVWSMMAFNLLPDTPGEPAEILPENTILDGYGDTDQVFLYEPGTPFTRRGLWDEPTRHTHRSYRVRRPLHVYPSFPSDKATISIEDTAGQGRGYYLVDTIAALLAAGTLRETTEGP